MVKIAIISDSSCDLPKFIVEKYNIKILPLKVVYSYGEYLDGVEIQPHEVYDKLKEEVPTTSLPSINDITNLFDQLVLEGYTDAICISISSGLSGTFNMFNLAANGYNQNDLKIRVVDSKTLSMFLGFMVLEAAKIVKESNNIAIEHVLNKVSSIRDKLKGCYILNTLEYLRKGGRIGKVEGAFAEMLNIKPVIGINDDGVYYTIAKSRGRKKSIKKMKQLLEDNFKGKTFNIAVLHGRAEEEAKSFLEDIKKKFNVKEFIVAQISPALGVHTGPGLLGYAAYEV